jgi:hypothetical protein
MQSPRIGHREACSIGDHQGDAIRANGLLDTPDRAGWRDGIIVMLAGIDEQGASEER